MCKLVLHITCTIFVNRYIIIFYRTRLKYVTNFVKLGIQCCRLSIVIKFNVYTCIVDTS